jgi:5-methylcytosine-specific restriction endonuclease McrBC GTP-binding regulatory subunit McrB
MNTEKKRRHKGIIEFLSKYDQYGNKGKGTLTHFDKTFSSTTIKNLSDHDINNAVVVFTDVLNIGNGSANSMNFYNLLQAYITVPERREEFNKLADEIIDYRYKKIKQVKNKAAQ